MNDPRKVNSLKDGMEWCLGRIDLDVSDLKLQVVAKTKDQHLGGQNSRTRPFVVKSNVGVGVRELFVDSHDLIVGPGTGPYYTNVGS